MSSNSRPKSLAERLDWMSINFPGFRDERDFVDQVQTRAAVSSLIVLSDLLAPEDQVKSINLTYSHFCLLIGFVAAQVGSDQDATGEWSSLYKQLGGSL